MERKIHRLTRAQRIEEEKQFTVNGIIDVCKNSKWRNIGITSSSRNYRGIDTIIQLLNKRSKEKGLELSFCELKPVAYFAEALEEAKKCDGLILSESYGYTYYSELDKCTRLLEENNIPIGGVVIVR